MNCKLLPLFILFFVTFSPVQAKMFKWVDEEGNVHFGDNVPNQYLNKEHKELNAQGAIIEEHEEIKPETEEQKREKIRLVRLKREEAEKAKKQAKRDRVLLDTYTTERDLIAARDARLDAVGSQLQLSKSIIADAKRKLEITEQQIIDIESGGKAVPQNISDKMKAESEQLNVYQEVAAGHQKRKQEISEQFESYIKRFSELKANQKRIKEEREARRRESY